MITPANIRRGVVRGIDAHQAVQQSRDILASRMEPLHLEDPRAWPRTSAAGTLDAKLHAAARGAIDAATGREADAFDATARALLAAALREADGAALAGALASAPSAAVARHLLRLLAEVERRESQDEAALRSVLFAIPLIVVAALDSGAAPATLSGVLSDTRRLESILRDARALGGVDAFALSGALVGADAIGLAALPALAGRSALADARGAPVDLAPAPIEVRDPAERVHLRFIAGAALAPPRVDPLAEPNIGAWGLAFARELGTQIGVPGVTLLALPRPPQRLVPALPAGRAAQREVAAQVFASSAIRRLRASFGEPNAVVSAHRAADAPGGGELRLSLSSPFGPGKAEGFRCPVYAYETVGDVAAMLARLMRDCRVANVRFVPGIHADIDPATGGPLFLDETAATRMP